MKFLRLHRAPFVLLAPALLAFILIPRANAQQNRITRPVDNLERVTLPGNLYPKATPANDRGRVSPSLNISPVTLTFAQSASQKADLDNLLAAQQTPGSPDYHRWLTPEQYADRFGIGQSDLNQITSWLRGQGLTIVSIARSRTWVAVNGSAAQVEAAFQTELHVYQVDGETHFANATAPSLPAALAPVVESIRGLNDFRARPLKRAPRFTSTTGSGNHYLAPNDLATIYGISGAWNAGINGSGQKIVIAGQTAIDLSDVQQFRANYNLPVNDPQILQVPGSPPLQIIKADLPEADLDLEWSGAVARNAAIIFVVYYNDVMSAVMYAIDNDLAPVVSTSYGSCEQETGSADALIFQKWARQGNAQGITWVNASGDDGAADCGDAQNPGLSVDVPASIPEVTGVGGTEFVEGGGQYWNATNDANSASALSWIPETSWNDSLADGTPSASGGGASIVFLQPSWQAGHPGVPQDGARHVPDVSLSASADHDGYLVYTGGQTQVYGGTSVPTPVFAGVLALVNQSLQQSVSGLGNVNPKLYSLAQTNPGIFHDITTGNNIVTTACSKRAATCANTAVGYNAGVAYDSVTGLGSVDVWSLVAGWNGGTTVIPPPPASPTVNLTLLGNLTSMTAADTVFLTATAMGAGGATPVGAVTFTAGTTALGSVSLTGSAGTATATLAVEGSQLAPGSQTIAATYNGGSSAVTADVTLSVQATGSNSNGVPAISSGGLTNAASYRQVFAPGMILSVFGANLASSTVTAGSVPLPASMAGIAVTLNGQSVPLWYVSPTQLNIQIPYETTVGVPATLAIDNNGQVVSSTFLLSSAAPGIFSVPQSGAIANGLPSGIARGQITTLYLTGAGAVTPSIATGAAPSSTTALSALPAPILSPVTVTVGGVPSPFLQFVGIPSGLVGVLQVNFEVPAGIAAGTQPVVVTIGGHASAPANLIVIN